MGVSEGERAPDFTVVRDGGGEVSLSDLKGRKVILYFYPRDNTPGCTTEARDFRDALPDFTGLSAEIIGISRDSVKSHDGFRQRHDLNFALGADVDGAVCEAYGTWVQKKLYGRVSMGIERSTFLIDTQGVIRRVWRKVRVKGHVEQVLAAVRDLDAERQPG